jgi:hypothetical protein
VLHRVVEHVDEELREPVRVTHHRQSVRANVERHAGLSRLHVERRDRAAKQVRRGDVLVGDELDTRLELRHLQ